MYSGFGYLEAERSLAQVNENFRERESKAGE